MEVEDNGTTGPGRNMPDDDLFTVRRVQHMLFGFRKAGRLWRRALGGGYRKQEGALRKKQSGKPAGITDRNDNQQPFQGGHDFARAPGYIPLTMVSVTFFASPSSIMVLS